MIKEKDKLTIKEIAKMLNLSEAVARVHLCCLDKFRVPFVRPTQYYYNYAFLLNLRDFYIEKSNSLGKKYEVYKKVVIKLNQIIKLWEKKFRANIS